MMNIFHPYYYITAALCLLVLAAVPAVAKTPDAVKEITFKSTHLDTEETFWVLTPPGYDDAENAERKYHAVWFVQGRPGNLGPYQELMESGVLEPCLVIASDVDGGEAAWSDVDRPTESYFIEEVVPYVREHFRLADGPGSICGQSKGGSGAVRLALKYPELFHSVVSYDGALGLYDSNRPYDALKEQFKDLAERNHDAIQGMPVLLIGGGWFHEAAAEYEPELREMGLHVRRIEVQEAGHSGGLMTQLLGAEVATTHMNGWIEAERPTPQIEVSAVHSTIPVEVTIDVPAKKIEGSFRYTLDGTPPTAESPEYKGPITLEESAVVRAQTYSSDGTQRSHLAVQRVTIHQLRPAASGVKSLQPGLASATYPGAKGKTAPDAATPADTGTVDTASRPVPAEKEQTLHVWSGYLIVPETGVYTIDLRVAQSRAWLTLDDIESDEARRSMVRQHVALEAGPHPIRVAYLHERHDREGSVSLKWALVGEETSDVPADALRHATDGP